MYSLYSKISKFGWSDEGKNIKLYVTELDGIKEHSSDKIHVQFAKDSFDLKIDGFKGKNLRLCYPTLSHAIDPEKSKYTIKSSSISVTLVKANANTKWKDLKPGDGSAGGLGGGMGAGLPGMGGMGGMPGMGGMGGMDMEDYAAAMGGMGGTGEEEGGDPNKGLMDMMKKMYEEGDDETKKMMTEAMMKAQNDDKSVPTE